MGICTFAVPSRRPHLTGKQTESGQGRPLSVLSVQASPFDAASTPMRLALPQYHPVQADFVARSAERNYHAPRELHTDRLRHAFERATLIDPLAAVIVGTDAHRGAEVRVRGRTVMYRHGGHPLGVAVHESKVYAAQVARKLLLDRSAGLELS